MQSIHTLKAKPTSSNPLVEVHEVTLSSLGDSESFSSDRKDIEEFYKEYFSLSPKGEEIIMESVGPDLFRVTSIHTGGPFFGAQMKQYPLLN